MSVALIGVPAGAHGAGDLGDANDPAAVDRWRLHFEAAMRLADELGCPTLSVLAGNRLAGVSMVVQLNTFRDNLAWALPRAAAAGRILTLELLNPDDSPRYLLTDPGRVRALLEAVGDPALRLQFDTYHFGRAVPDVATSFRELAPIVGHVQVGDVPDRHEPGTGAIEWTAFFATLADSGYHGSVGLRYEPSAGTFEGLRWIEDYGLDRAT
jgi:hydroxypyruvate isomerase